VGSRATERRRGGWGRVLWGGLMCHSAVHTIYFTITAHRITTQTTTDNTNATNIAEVARSGGLQALQH